MKIHLKKSLVFTIIVANIGFLGSIFYMFYFKEASFDTSKKANLNCNLINSVYSESGNWIWNKKNFDFYNEYTFSLNKTQIIEFCKIINKSKAKYIENIKPTKWLEIQIEKKDGSEAEVYLKRTIDNETYFEINHDTFEGSELEKFIHLYTKKN